MSGSSNLDREDVLKIARLARLELDEAEVALYQDRLGRVLEYVRELNQVKTEKAATVKHVPRDAVSIREDRAIEFTDREALLRNAPAQIEEHFLVPTVIEQN
ncbi:MAG: Asp-tRNA(Asn)/Glu-tRNA(Gln) amidotransferase subunit GatC [Bdellovibrionales bacterium]|nr:Asp-tRNA(Asn)/Glu-tRNA(Gln) amidotransferase subunit GatC [Bdellovibrionales bacterium]